MAPHAFMLEDIGGSLAAVTVFPLFAMAPGFALGWLLDLFQFRTRTAGFRIVLSIPVSIAVCPIATYLAGRFGLMWLGWVLYAFSWAYCAWLAARTRPRLRLSRDSVVAGALLIGWTAVAVLSLVDLQLGGRNYFSVTAFDYSVRSEFIHSINSSIPPGNPFFYPGHSVPLRYHYFWLLVCGLAQRIGGPLVAPRHAWVGGTVWIGFGLMAITVLYLRLFFYRGPATFRRRALTGVLLLTITGLDILPTAIWWALQAAGMPSVLPSMEWWNEQVDGFVYTALWEAHYLCGLIACLTAFLLLREAARQTALRPRLCHVAVAGAALASAGGASIYVSGVFALFLVFWTAAAVFKRWWTEAANLAAAGLVAVALLLPYARTLANTPGGSGGGTPVQFHIRSFSPVDAILQGQGLDRGYTLPLVDAALLPLNYLLELGFFFAAAVIWWRRRNARGQPLTRSEAALATMVATSVVVCTFFRSSVIGNNDLGWRGFLIAQFGLLLWGVDVMTDQMPARGHAHRRLLAGLAALGILGTVYDAAMLRFYPVLADRGIVRTISWMSPDRQFGKRNYAAREAYEWIKSATDRNAIVQFDPHVASQDTAAFLYAGRQFAAGDESCLTNFGGDPVLCPPVLERLDEIYPTKGRPASPTREDACRNLALDILVAKDTDAVWQDRSSWVWNEKPAFANPYVRVFRCDRTAVISDRLR